MRQPATRQLATFAVQVMAIMVVAAVGTALYWRAYSMPAAPQARPAAGSAGTPTPGAGISYRKEILPLFRARCAECHLDGNGSGGLHLDTYQGLLQGGNLVPGSIIHPRDHARSVLWQIVQPGGNWPGGNRMPLSGPPYLSDGQIRSIAAWIDQGASDN